MAKHEMVRRLPMCLFAAIGLLAPRLILVLMWLLNSAFILQPFEGFGVPNPVLPIAGLVFLPTTTLGFCWATASFGGLSEFSGMLVVAIWSLLILVCWEMGEVSLSGKIIG